MEELMIKPNNRIISVLTQTRLGRPPIMLNYQRFTVPPNFSFPSRLMYFCMLYNVRHVMKSDFRYQLVLTHLKSRTMNDGYSIRSRLQTLYVQSTLNTPLGVVVTATKLYLLPNKEEMVPSSHEHESYLENSILPAGASEVYTCLAIDHGYIF